MSKFSSVLQNRLAVNTAFLYLLTLSNYVFAFITVPYQTRVLGPETFGLISFVLAIHSYFILVIDFGFILSATKKVADNKDNNTYIGRLLTEVTIAKILLGGISGILIFLFSCIFSKLYSNLNLIFLYLLLAILTSLTPDFIYRGRENMKMVTIRIIIVRLLFTCLIFLFLKKPEQYLLIPIFQIIGVFLSLLFVYYDLTKNEKIQFIRTSLNGIINTLRDSNQFFWSRIASSLYGAANTLIIGAIYPSDTMVGYYASAEKFKAIASQAASPIADSLYPYMIRTKDFKMLWRILIILEIVVIIVCLYLLFYAEELCVLIFGDEYAFAANILRLMIPSVAIVLPNYLLGFPALTPIGQQKWANYSVEIAMLVYLVCVIICYWIGLLNVYSVCILTIVADLSCFLVRIIFFLRKKRAFDIVL